MRPMGDTRRHFFLTLGMARACDVDLGAALKSGRLSRGDYAGLVTRCRGCAAPERCAALVAGGTRLGAAPGYCVNAAMLARLRAAPVAV